MKVMIGSASLAGMQEWKCTRVSERFLVEIFRNYRNLCEELQLTD